MSQFRGTSLGQDSRFGNKDRELMRKMRKSSVLSQKVDLSKVNMEVINGWIEQRVTELLGFEDDVLIDMVSNLLAMKADDPAEMQLQLTGFLAKRAAPFMEELWSLLLSAQKQPSGIPQELIEAKKREIAAAKPATNEVASALQRRGVQEPGPAADGSGGHDAGRQPHRSRWGERQQPADQNGTAPSATSAEDVQGRGRGSGGPTRRRSRSRSRSAEKGALPPRRKGSHRRRGGPERSRGSRGRAEKDRRSPLRPEARGRRRSRSRGHSRERGTAGSARGSRRDGEGRGRGSVDGRGSTRRRRRRRSRSPSTASSSSSSSSSSPEAVAEGSGNW